MDKDKNKGLADSQNGEFILNESGTSVSVDADVEYFEDKNLPGDEDESGNNGKKIVSNE